ncbi:Fibropellin-1, partial [Varanus komodoensis]
PFCEEHVEPCSSQPCQNEAVCHNHNSGYFCECTAGYIGHDCETDVNECFSRPCQNGGTCTDMPNDVICTCSPMFTGKFCEKVVTPCEPSPCLNNGDCIEELESYHCSCMPGYTGWNCEEVIDYCRLLSINCLNEGLCLNIIGGFSCLCTPGWTGEFCQFVENACLIYSDKCHSGATCVDVSQSKLHPQTECMCPTGFTESGTKKLKKLRQEMAENVPRHAEEEGEKGNHIEKKGQHFLSFYPNLSSKNQRPSCETETDECDSNPCKHGGSCNDYIGHFKCICPIGYEGQQCEVDVDACLFRNVSCKPGAECVDKPYELAYMCGKACQRNAELCANGGRCFHDEDNWGYQCVCAAGWTGPTCLENINDCEVIWCQNGGTCEDGINEY